MRVTVELNTPEVQGPSSAHLILRDPETSLPVAEIAIRGAGYIVLSEEERASIVESLRWAVDAHFAGSGIEIPDREGGYHSDEPPLWQTTAAEQAAKRGTPSRVATVGGKKVKVVDSLDDIVYPEGCQFDPFSEFERDLIETLEKFETPGIVKVPSRKGEDADGKRFRRACKRARAQQYAFLASKRDPSSVEEGDADEDSED